LENLPITQLFTSKFGADIKRMFKHQINKTEKYFVGYFNRLSGINKLDTLQYCKNDVALINNFNKVIYTRYMASKILAFKSKRFKFTKELRKIRALRLYSLTKRAVK
jgi:hypothetical protein